MNRVKTGLAVVAVLLMSACGTSEPSPSTSGDAAAAPVVLDVTIIDGEVTPRGARVNLKVGQPLTLSIHSDQAEKVHVHTHPAQTFPIKAGGQHRVTFSVDRPGKVVVEVHHLHAVVAEVLVHK